MASKPIISIFLMLILQSCWGLPVKQQIEEKPPEQPDSSMNNLEDYMEYHRYLKEVVNALESDPDFRKKLELANETDIKSGKIAEELQFVSHHVRNRLDEIKRIELRRLTELTERKRRLEQENNVLIDDPVHHHLDQANQHTFEIEDLKKLIAKTTQDLAEADRKRKEEFKQYEMEKEYQRQNRLNHTNGVEEREKVEKEYKEMEEKHKKHEKLHQPGHKAQLEEVWEEQDQMQQDFNPKTFFMLHDVDGNGLWDQEEVKALFIKELEKMYQQGAPEDDMRERVEELERMRESVFKEMDFNRDGFIDYPEFLQQTKSNDFKQDHGWQGLDEQTKPYSEAELNEYVRQYHQYGGIAPPPPPGVPVYQPQGVPPYQQVPHPQQGGYPHPQQFNNGYPPHPGVPPQHFDVNNNQVYPNHPVPPPQHHPQQPQQQQQQQINHIPPAGYQQQQQYNNLPNEIHPNAIPVNQQQQLNAPLQRQPSNVQQQQQQQQPQFQPPVPNQNQPNIPPAQQQQIHVAPGAQLPQQPQNQVPPAVGEANQPQH